MAESESNCHHERRRIVVAEAISAPKAGVTAEEKKNQVLLEGYVEVANNEDDLKRTKSLTDDDLDELKGCLDLGFGFSYDEIPELCNTLPALELCYSMSQKFLDEQHKSPERSSPTAAETASSPIANWKISSPVQARFINKMDSGDSLQYRAFTNYLLTSAFAEVTNLTGLTVYFVFTVVDA
ncbi:hypothetical protein GH714_008136 [Hevea brasiliensis]|uniref:Uncharacterized protein n=1 Tax=Hevea brasiliensis TaxID=3981 RepID=A0A6A6N950_HEVBR|nr:hypothetical protein GH714_008136 [Hevea brasiliensis]